MPIPPDQRGEFNDLPKHPRAYSDVGLDMFSYFLLIPLRHPLPTLDYAQFLKHHLTSYFQLSALSFLLLNFYSCLITKTKFHLYAVSLTYLLLQSKSTVPKCWELCGQFIHNPKILMFYWLHRLTAHSTWHTP